MLKLTDINCYYGESHIIRDVSLEVASGSIVALLGRNGMGKTTLVHSIIGFNVPRKGSVLFKQVDVTGLPPYKIARMGIGLVPQGRRIFQSLSVRRNLAVAVSQKSDAAWSVDGVCALFPILEARAGTKAALLSGGEQQMLAIARALVTGPELLLMDEPSEGLAPIIVQQIGSIISEIRKRGLSIFLVEQNLGLALELSDDVFIMSMGQIVYRGKAAKLADDREIQEKHLGVR
jgi:branched-chain amino acid transport system ATP-binding protein